MLLKRILAFHIILLSFNSFAQRDISGIWEGKFSTPVFIMNPIKLVAEINIYNDSMVSGVTHLYYADNKYEHYKIIGKFRKKDSLIVFIEAATIAVDLGDFGNCLGTYMMSIKRTGNTLHQQGLWTSNIKGCSPNAAVWLEKQIPEIVKAPAKKTIIQKRNVPVKKPIAKTTLVVPKQKAVSPAPKISPVVPEAPKKPVTIRSAPAIVPAKVSQRQTDVQSLIEIAPKDKDSIKVEVYDNGDIDGDSVSVYEDARERISRKKITDKPLIFYVTLNKDINPISNIRLVAESVGSIPPCTALMIITTKSKRYEVRLSSNFSKNATVELFLKE